MEKQTRPSGLRTWIEVDRSALTHNYRVLRKLLPKKTRLMAVVKSNAYGHGLVDFSREIVKLGANWLGVDSLIEGIRLRKEGITTPILVLGYTLPENYKDAAAQNISLALSSLEQLRAAIRSKEPLKIHLKIDTGMHRQGFFVTEMEEVVRLLKRAPWIAVEGVCTHFAGKDPHELPENRSQIEKYTQAVQILNDAGFKPIRHAGSTWGMLGFPEAHCDMVRAGIGLYGMWPSEETALRFKKKVTLKPALSWKTIISEIKTIPEAGGVGYGFSEVVEPGTRIAICPIGYWHGYPRALSSVGEVLARGKRAKLIGRVSMDMIAIDVTQIKGVTERDVVTLIGGEGKGQIRVEEFSSKVPGSLNYEIVTRINPLIKKFYL